MHSESLEQKILSNKEQLAFFHNIKNKQHLCGNDFVQSSTLPMLVNNRNETFKISSGVTKVFDWNQKESNARIIFHVLQQKKDIAVCSKDMEVVVLMVFAYALTEINEKWVIKVETNKEKCRIIETNVSIKFPQIHKVTGCDTTSFLLSVGKNVLTSLAEVSVRLYKQIKTKTFQSLPPYKKSMLQAIKCILY